MMSRQEFVPLPDVDPERDGIAFGSLGFPIGFDEERLLVNVGRVQTVTKIGGVGRVSVVGVTGEETTFAHNVSGVNSDGSASVGLGVFKNKQPVVNGVRIGEMPEQDNQYVKPDVVVEVNTAERDRILSEKYKHGQLNPRGQAELLSRTMADGLATGVKLRQLNAMTGVEKIVSRFMFPFYTVGDVMAITENEVAYRASGLLALWGVGNVVIAKLTQPSPDTSIREAHHTATWGYERRFAAQALARYSTLIKVAK